MNKVASLRYGLDTLIALMATLAGLAVLQTFIVGKHYIIPTAILVMTVFLGNLAAYGFRDYRWAKVINFWIGVLLSCHMFFALFWSKRYREILGDAFIYVGAVVFAVLLLLTVQYARRNRLFE